MKKLFIYLIIFISVFAGTASCIVLNGYINYEKNKENIVLTEPSNNIVTTLASSILESEAYSGNIEFYSSDKLTNLNGTFSYINKDQIMAEINLSGYVNNFNVNTSITLLNSSIFVDFNGIKLSLETTDVITILNSVLGIINTQSSSNIAKIDLASLSSSLNNINLTETNIGLTLNLPIPNLCNIYLLTTQDYIPKQILLTNLNFGKTSYTLNVTAEQKPGEITEVNTDDYLNISSSVPYIEPIVNTLLQEKLRISGYVKIDDIILNLNIYKNNNLIQGEIEYNNIKINFELENGLVVAKFYNNYFKFTLSDAIKEFSTLLHIPKNISLNITTTEIKNLLSKFNASAKVENNTITNFNVEYNNLSLSVNIGKTLIFPQRLEPAVEYLTAKDIVNIINYFKNVLSNKYSVDVTATLSGIKIAGKAYININENFNSINEILFDGYLNGKILKVWYHTDMTYITFDGNNVKIASASIPKLIDSISSLAGVSLTDSENLFSNFDFNNIYYKNKEVKLTNGIDTLSLLSYGSYYKLTLKIGDVNAICTVYPNANNYSYINNSLNPGLFNDFSYAPKIVTALSNTLNQSTIYYSGSLSINLLEYTYKNIGIDFTYHKNTNKMVLKLKGLPIDSVVTYFSNLYYQDQTCTLTIENGNIRIYTTVTTKILDRVAVVTDKTIPIKDFSIDNLYDIMGMRKSIIELIKKQNSTGDSSEFLKGLNTDCVKLLKNSLLFNYKTEFNKFIASLSMTFDYGTYINGVNASLNLGNIIFVNLKLYDF